MTIKRTAPTSYGPGEYFPERPLRGDMQNWIYLGIPGHQAALIRHFGYPETTIVMSEIPVGWSLRQRSGLLYPDLLVAFNVDRAGSYSRMGYSLEEQGKPPEFALEIASPTTAVNDYTTKRTGYAAFGVPEFWRFDATGGRLYGAALAGDRLVDGEYQSIDIVPSGEGSYWGHSGVLNLDLCCESGRLRWYDPAAGSYLLTYEEEAEGRVAEREARIAAEADAADAQARIRDLEDKLRRRS